jgi:hypothetical protein
MPSFEKTIVGIITAMTLTIAAGRGDLVVKAVSEMRKLALTEAKKSWGNPSIFRDGRN